MAEEQQNLQETEEKVMQILSNDPSDPVVLEGYDVAVVFQRPSFKDKYKGRAWATKKLREFGYRDAVEEDPELTYFFRTWGMVNMAVQKLYRKNEKGKKNIRGEAYSEYSFDSSKDLDFSGPFEKYAMKEVFDKGKAEDMFVAAGIIAYNKWMETFEVDGDDIKNS